jgi:hypothetical protein
MLSGLQRSWLLSKLTVGNGSLLACDRAIGGGEAVEEEAVKTISHWSLRYKLLIILVCLGITAFAVTLEPRQRDRR